ncbi:bacteriophage SPP1 complete nucleotide sequence [Bacillus sp. BT1B_CT2]|uniref:N-acetylmuramoyl-L-alanine amidase family protein n=1 Tax=Bacillus TaxID=1386 RepID=UPI0001F44325|nr:MULTISPECIES: N-acetylmuramoyl-L-alanine amidase [Bacillus]EFV71603.1 bacteriophage SPP1 complete nucleotide sequence [Bacillus sp. BT1B_CT2]MDE1423796.1 N-acetylmuramoyl-L-alanine amidase [Bacillus licheniformis]MDH3155457.1 N-acetylmuramoyl-L-alanine amidase [Bacillus licheniformis]MEC5225225.1 N-acetylmuramoyl-L-alanine amidase [Bacillus licheniformis]TWK37787.1 Sporulation-specific N-acetylmuramoyl-L-alanine amidase [Bacillus paralicheniformis]
MAKKIMIDPGHGGHDSGAAANGLKEKDLVLAIAKKTKSILEKEYDVLVKLTRSTDVFIELAERSAMANKWGADYFVSIHINAGGGTGFETYRFHKLSTSSGTGQKQAAVHKAIFNKIKGKGVKDRGTKSANYAVLRGTKMAAILTENLFIDNKNDAALLKQASFIDLLARGHAEGIAEAVGLKKAAKKGTVEKGVKLVVVKPNADGWLWVYDKPDWGAKYKKVKPGEAFTIDQTLTVNGSKMYKLKSGLYITASTKYVEVKQK